MLLVILYSHLTERADELSFSHTFLFPIPSHLRDQVSLEDQPLSGARWSPTTRLEIHSYSRKIKVKDQEQCQKKFIQIECQKKVIQIETNPMNLHIRTSKKSEFNSDETIEQMMRIARLKNAPEEDPLVQIAPHKRAMSTKLIKQIKNWEKFEIEIKYLSSYSWQRNLFVNELCTFTTSTDLGLPHIWPQILSKEKLPKKSTLQQIEKHYRYYGHSWSNEDSILKKPNTLIKNESVRKLRGYVQQHRCSKMKRV